MSSMRRRQAGSSAVLPHSPYSLPLKVAARCQSISRIPIAPAARLSPSQPSPAAQPPASGCTPLPPMESSGFQEVAPKSRCAQPGAGVDGAEGAAAPLAPPHTSTRLPSRRRRPPRASPCPARRPQEADAPAPTGGAERGCWRRGSCGPHCGAPHRCRGDTCVVPGPPCLPPSTAPNIRTPLPTRSLYRGGTGRPDGLLPERENCCLVGAPVQRRRPQALLGGRDSSAAAPSAVEHASSSPSALPLPAG